jgi:ComF family protein
MKYAQQPYLAKGAAAFMVAQWANLEWPMPDIVVPVPMSFTHWLERGYNQSELLAKEIATLLDRPMVNALGRKSGDYSQAGLSISQRRSLEGSRFYLRSNQLLYDKTILLIDDVITSGTTLNRCAEALMEGHPGVVYGLSFCKA